MTKKIKKIVMVIIVMAYCVWAINNSGTMEGLINELIRLSGTLALTMFISNDD